MKNCIENIIDIFNSKSLFISIVALDRDCELVNNVLKSSHIYQIALPSCDNITSETKIVAETKDIKSFVEQLLSNDSRGITIYGFNGDLENKKVLMHKSSKNKNDYIFVNKCVVDFVFTIAVDENYYELKFNKDLFNPETIFSAIKGEGKETRGTVSCILN